jgi:hypothetical protein
MRPFRRPGEYASDMLQSHTECCDCTRTWDDALLSSGPPVKIFKEYFLSILQQDKVESCTAGGQMALAGSISLSDGG